MVKLVLFFFLLVGPALELSVSVKVQIIMNMRQGPCNASEYVDLDTFASIPQVSLY